MTAPELKPCPFCGGHLEMVSAVHYRHPKSKCVISGHVFPKGHIGQWNRRAALAQVQVKPLVWIRTGENRYSAKSEDYKVVTDGKCWAFCPEDWPPFAGYSYLTADAAKAAAQADYEARIRALIAQDVE